MKTLTLRAPAKINLRLMVGPKRKDGYHSVDTIFQEISLADTLQLSRIPSPDIKLTVSGRTIPSGENLVVRALRELKTALGVSSGLHVRLTKRIPIGAGLGGGSSDAAAALWGGWRIWTGARTSRGPIPPLLLKLARRLGADVPFFLRGGRARGRGIGDRLTPLRKTARRWWILIYPRIHVSTREAYRLLDRERNRTRSAFRSEFFNSFEPVVMKAYPSLARVPGCLQRVGCRPVLMSGSGSTFFGGVSNRSQGLRIKAGLRHRGWDIFLVHTP